MEGQKVHLIGSLCNTRGGGEFGIAESSTQLTWMIKSELPNSFLRGDPDHGVAIRFPATPVRTCVRRIHANQSVESLKRTSSRDLSGDGGFDEHAGQLGL